MASPLLCPKGMKWKLCSALIVLALALGQWLELSPADGATSVTFQPSTIDSYLKQDASTTNFGTTSPIYVKASSAGKNRRTVVKFDVSSIPTDGAIKSATLSLFMVSVTNGTTSTIGAHRITGSTLWTEAAVTWNTRDGVTNWTTAGGDFNAATSSTTPGSTINVFVNWSINADVQAWVNGSAVNNGTLLKDENESTSSMQCQFSSKEDTTAANRPMLGVTYLLKVRDLTATAGNTQVILNWVLPGTSPDYNGTLVIRRAGGAPTSTPVDGTNYTAGTTLPDGSVVVSNDTTLATTVTDTGLTNGTTYYYQTFARDSSVQYSLASATVNSTPTTTVAPNPNWSYATSAASLAPPGLDPNDVVVSGSNDNKLHGMHASNGTRAFNPFTTGGAIQSRPPVIPAAYSTTGVNVAYVSSQDGFLYAVNTSTGAQVWKSASLGTTLQGGAAVWLQAFKALTIGGATRDAVFVGTRNTGSTTNNKVYALNGDTGAILWTFNSGGTSSVDIISSTPYVDYVNNAVWVTSRSAGGTGQPSLWKLDAATGAVISSLNLGDIDASPTPSWDGSFIYVGTNAGQLRAIRVSDNAPFTYTPASGTGGIKGLPWPLGFVTPSVATPDTIVFTRDTTVHSVNFNGSAFSANWTMTPTGTPTVSAPVDDGANHLYIGASDGKVHQLDVATGTDQKQVTIVPGTPTVGDPAFDVTLNRIYVGATDGHIYSFSTPF